MNNLLVYAVLLVLIIVDLLETRKFMTKGFSKVSDNRLNSTLSSPRWILRTGFVRSTFVLMDIVALFCFKIYPEILAVIAGLRMTEILPYIDYLRNLDNSEKWAFVESISVPSVNFISSMLFLRFFI